MVQEFIMKTKYIIGLVFMFCLVLQIGCQDRTIVIPVGSVFENISIKECAIFRNPITNGTTRMCQSNDNLHVDRLENDMWVFKTSLAESIFTGNYLVDRDKNPSLSMLFDDNVTEVYMIHKKTGDDGIEVGNTLGDTIGITENNFYVRSNVAEIEGPIFAGDNETLLNINNITFFYEIPSFGVGVPFDSAINKNVSFFTDRNSSDEGLRIHMAFFDLNQSDTKPLHESDDFFDFQQGNVGFTIQASENRSTLVLNPTVSINSGVFLRVDVTFDRLVNLTASTYNNETNISTGLNITNQKIPQYIAGGTVQETARVHTIKNIVAGEMYIKDNVVQTSIPGADVYVNVTLGFTEEFTNDLTISNGKFIIQESGRYDTECSVSAQDGNNKIFHFSIGINGVDQDNIHIPRKVGAGGDIGSWSLGGTILVNKSDEVTLMVENPDDGSDVLINDANCKIKRLWDN